MTLSSAMHSGVNPTWNTNRGNINQFRSRSLNDLPGSLRVPILKKHDRLKPKIEASLAGLKELQNLRDQQQKKFEEAISNFGFKDGRRKSAELSDVRTGKRRHSADFVDNSSSLADYRRNSIDSVDSTDFENLLQKVSQVDIWPLELASTIEIQPYLSEMKRISLNSKRSFIIQTIIQ